MVGGFSFRYKARLSWGSRLPFDQTAWRFPGRSHDLRVAALKDGVTLRESEWIVLLGDGYDNEDAAAAAGIGARHALQRAFALLRLGADFGDHYNGGISLAEDYLRQIEAEVAAPVLVDNRHLMTFRSEPRPRFYGFSARGRVNPPLAAAVNALSHPGAEMPLSEQEQLAHRLFGASFFVDESPEARLLLLMAAVEALLDFRPRSEGARRLVETWRKETRSADISAAERDSIVGLLGFMMQESIGQAGQRLVADALAGRKYGDLEPGVFFRRTYGLRSRIAHPSERPPDRADVVNAIPHLQAMAGDLLAGRAMLSADSGIERTRP